MVFGSSTSFNLMINCFRTMSLLSIGTYIRQRREEYTFIAALIPNCTINGHSSSTGKTSKSPNLPRFAPTISVLANLQNSIHFQIYISRDICQMKVQQQKKPPTARNEIPCKKKKSWAPLKCMTSGERNEVQNPQIRKIRSHRQISKVSVKVCLCLQ